MYGFKGLQDFRSRRRAAISAISDMKNGDWFHNGTKVLPVVLETIDGLEKDFRKSDKVTGPILEKLVKNMLDDPEARFTAKQAHVFAIRILHRRSIIESPVVSSGSQQAAPLPTAATVGTHGRILSPDSGPLTEDPQPVPNPVDPNTSAGTTCRSSAPGEESQPVQKYQNGSNSNLNIPISNLPKTELQSSTASASGSSRSANRSPTPLGPPLIPTVSILRSNSSRRPSIGNNQTELPRLEVDIAERWIQEKRAGRGGSLPGKYLLGRLETRDHACVYLLHNFQSLTNLGIFNR